MGKAATITKWPTIYGTLRNVNLINNVAIREATPADAHAIRQASQHMVDENPSSLLCRRLQRVPAGTEAELIESIGENSNALIVVAEEVTSSAVVGLLICDNTATASRQHVIQLGIGVRQAWWRRGVDDHMLRQAIAWGKRNPTLRRIEVEVLRTETQLLALLARMNFRVEGRGRGAYFVGGHYVDCYWLSLPIGTTAPL